jgi:hypothetical protein
VSAGAPHVPPPSHVYDQGVTVALVPIVRNHPGTVNPLIKSNNLLNNALATKQSVTVSPKFWAEHLGLPYHQTDIRQLEVPDPKKQTSRLMALSEGSRSFMHYGYGDLLREDRIGVWVQRPDKGIGREDKIAAIGIRIKRWVTLHGLALNVDCDLSHYSGIVPCGVAEPRYGVTSLADLGVQSTMAEIDKTLRREFEPLFGPVDYAAAADLIPNLPAM